MAAEDPPELSPPDPSLRPLEHEVVNASALRVTLSLVLLCNSLSTSLSTMFLPFVFGDLCGDDKREEERGNANEAWVMKWLIAIVTDLYGYGILYLTSKGESNLRSPESEWKRETTADNL